ncbi:MAG TPA: CtsR family transcriptional regulator [Bacillota bacterium]|nr:CtsR family transcriptional regulator [Bacillota bacterium]HPV13871.1 CtsR family transcriptional regulator [Bacillota bacterium]
MASLADLIEAHIVALVEEAGGVVEIQRAILAEHFSCVPSQISYVLSSRFQPERGYVVESRRGGGGYIRIAKLEPEEDVADIIENVGNYLTQDEAYSYLTRLFEDDLIDLKMFKTMEAALSRDTLAVDLPLRDLLRARLFKAMLLAYFSVREDEE